MMDYNTKDTCYIKLKELASKVTKNVILEIGSKKGASAFTMASVSKVPIYCIDMWDLTLSGDNRPLKHKQLSNQDIFLSNLKGFNVIPIKGLSGEIAKVWEKPIGLLFIDGDHSYEGCKIDYEGFSKYVVSGGFLVIHDYIPKSKKYCGVELVVNEIVSKESWHNFETIGSTFTAIKI